MAEMFQKMATYGGGPASPMQVEVGKSENGEPTIWFSMGMTKREHIAAMALQGMLAHGLRNEDTPKDAIALADALLERFKK